MMSPSAGGLTLLSRIPEIEKESRVFVSNAPDENAGGIFSTGGDKILLPMARLIRHGSFRAIMPYTERLKRKNHEIHGFTGKERSD